MPFHPSVLSSATARSPSPDGLTWARSLLLLIMLGTAPLRPAPADSGGLDAGLELTAAAFAP